MNYSDRSSNPTMNTSSAKPGELAYKPSKQEMKTYEKTPTANLTKGGVGNQGGAPRGTPIGTSNKDVRYKGAGNPNRSYSVAAVNKAQARTGGH